MRPELQISRSIGHTAQAVTKLFHPFLHSGAELNTVPRHLVWELPRHDGPPRSSIFHVILAIGLPKIIAGANPETTLRKICLLTFLLLVLENPPVLVLFQLLIILTFRSVQPFSPDRKLCQQIGQANQCPDSLSNI